MVRVWTRTQGLAQGQGPGPLDPQKTGHGRPSSRTLVLKSDCNGGVFFCHRLKHHWSSLLLIKLGGDKNTAATEDTLKVAKKAKDES